MRGKQPTKANGTGKATASDSVMTPRMLAKRVVEYFNPTGVCLDPCAGDGAFYDYMPEPKVSCEITDGMDFFDFDFEVDWIITNPPYSIYDRFLEHSFEVADNVVFLVPISKAFKSVRLERVVMRYGGLREIIFMGGGRRYGFEFGFSVGCLHYVREYAGLCKITHWME